MTASFDSRIDRLEQELQQLKASAAIKAVFQDPINNGVALFDGQVTAQQILDGTITAPKYQALSVGAAAIADLAVTTAKIANLAVDATKIANATITDAQIANATITSAKIASLVADKITAGAGIIANLTVSATLTIGVGGKITDNDGSYWDKDGIVLAGTSSISDGITIKRTGTTSRIAIQSILTDTLLGDAQVSSYTSINALAYVAGLYGGGWLELYGRGHANIDNAYALLGVADDTGVGPALWNGITVGKRVAVIGQSGGDVSAAAVHGNGQGVIFIPTSGTIPSGNPTGGIILYMEAGSLKARTSAGNIRVIAAV